MLEDVKDFFVGLGFFIGIFIFFGILGWLYPWSAQEIIQESNYAKSVLGGLPEFGQQVDFATFDLVTNWCDDSFFLFSMIGNVIVFIGSVFTLIINLVVSFFFHPLDFFIDPLCTIGTIIYAINQISMDFLNIFTPLISWIVNIFSNHLDSQFCIDVRHAQPSFIETILKQIISVF